MKFSGGQAFDLLGCPALVGEIIVGMLLGPEAPGGGLLQGETVEALKAAPTPPQPRGLECS